MLPNTTGGNCCWPVASSTASPSSVPGLAEALSVLLGAFHCTDLRMAGRVVSFVALMKPE